MLLRYRCLSSVHLAVVRSGGYGCKRVKRWRCAGFSLIELLVVLAIVAILGSIAYPSYRHYQTRSVVTEARLSLQTLATTQEQLRLKRGRYQSLDELLTHVGVSDRIRQYYEVDLAIPGDGLAFRLSMVPKRPEETLPTMTLDHWGQFFSDGWVL